MAEKSFTVTGSPHVGTSRSTARVMWEVVGSLMPALACAIYFFGLRAAGVVAVSIAACVATEWLINRYMLNRQATIANGSAALTGLLLGMTLPSSLPYAMVAAGSVFAIGIGKMAFGGLGQNIFNPALVGRVFLLISFPVEMTTWPVPLGADGATGATFLTAMKESGLDGASVDLMQMALGNMGGSLGEVGAIALLLGGIYLTLRGIIKWVIPVVILVTVAIMAAIMGESIAAELLSGGLILGAVFMATDYVTSPMTIKGMIPYALLIGVITFVIRHYGAYPEGISFAILIMNGCTPLINRWAKPTVFGERRGKEK